MQQNVIESLVQQANKLPELKYDSNLIVFKRNIDTTIKKVKQRLGILQSLVAEIDYQLTLAHADDEEFT